MKEKTKITYRQVNGFLIPNIVLPPEQANIIIGKWGERVPVALKQARHDAQKLP